MPDNVRPISKASVDGKIYLDQVFLGSCVGGRIEDMQIAADILRRRKVNKNLRLIVIPGSQEIVKHMTRTGILETLIEAGASVCPPCCGPCGGRNLGVLAAGEKCASTTNRNFKGRMGHMDSEVYLVGPQVAAASAVLGYLASVEELS
jgi:3-isopropylmalate/(R)-2-methylmalate dehydratase large subunit